MQTCHADATSVPTRQRVELFKEIIFSGKTFLKSVKNSDNARACSTSRLTKCLRLNTIILRGQSGLGHSGYPGMARRQCRKTTAESRERLDRHDAL
jgi:hypothetical protein